MNASKLAKAKADMALRVSTVALAMWGVSTTLSSFLSSAGTLGSST
jgi:hypothetical protein